MLFVASYLGTTKVASLELAAAQKQDSRRSRRPGWHVNCININAIRERASSTSTAGSSCLARQQLQGVAATRSQPKNLEKILLAGMVRVNTLHNSSRRCSSSWSKGNGSGSSKWDLGDESKSSMRQCTNLSRLCARYLHEYLQEEEIGEFLTKT